MKTTIWYFTGTGNTLAIAKDLAQELSRNRGYGTRSHPLPDASGNDRC